MFAYYPSLQLLMFLVNMRPSMAAVSGKMSLDRNDPMGEKLTGRMQVRGFHSLKEQGHVMPLNGKEPLN